MATLYIETDLITEDYEDQDDDYVSGQEEYSWNKYTQDNWDLDDDDEDEDEDDGIYTDVYDTSEEDEDYYGGYGSSFDTYSTFDSDDYEYNQMF